MKNIKTQIENATSLQQVLELLNGYSGDTSLSDAVDLSGLPTFGPAPSDTTEVFSWNDSHCLIQNDCVGDDWVLVERCESCREADFNCTCED